MSVEVSSYPDIDLKIEDLVLQDWLEGKMLMQGLFAAKYFKGP